ENYNGDGFMIYPHNVIEEVRMNNDIAEVIGEDVTLKPQSGGYVGLCPFHHEKTPSFRVNSREQYFHCFGCGESGDVISYIMKSRNFDFTDAVKHLADRVHYPLPEAGMSGDYKKAAEERQTIYDINKKTARLFYENLQGRDGYFARQYLDNRRISGKIRGIYGLGYASYKSGTVVEFLKKAGYSEEIILKSGLASEKNGRLYDKFFNRLMFPIIDIHGRIIGFGGRVLDDGKPKYLNSPETPVFNKSSNLYSINLAVKEKTRELILVEGYMDVITLYQAGFRNVVAALGTSFNSNHTKLLKKYADRVILLFDSDEAGVKAVLRTIPVLLKSGIEVKVLQVTDAKDPDEYIKKFGSAAFGGLLKTAVSHIDFRLNLEKKNKNLNNMDEKVGYVKSAAEVLSTIDNEMERDLYAKRLAEETGVSVGSINTELEKQKTLENIPERKKMPPKTKNGEKIGLESAKKGIINIISYNTFVYDKISAVFKPEFLNDGVLEKLWDIIVENINKNSAVYPAEIINYFEKPEERDRVMKILTTKQRFESKTALEKNVNDYIKTISEAYYSDRINKEKDINTVKNLLADKRKLPKLYVKL
ncbi:MAG: DNA primase, partial [Clostridiales bacterium]|nr:DNA primase [Clostridiales bacterium]